MFVVVFRIQAIELSAWEKMQEKQKQIEQENKRKKAALQETIKKRWIHKNKNMDFGDFVEDLLKWRMMLCSCANCLSTSAYFTHNWYHKVVLGQEKKMYKGPIK